MRHRSKQTLLTPLIALLASLFIVESLSAQSTATPPRLVVNIVVGSMRAGDIDKYRDNLTATGFVRMQEGISCSSAIYNYQVGSTPTSLATITTGALPASHGVTGEAWYDYTTSQRVELCIDPRARDLEYDLDEGGHSPYNLIAPTLAEALRGSSSNSRTATVALDAVSSVVFNGRGGMALWIDPYSCEWATSTAYATALPAWVKSVNRSEMQQSYRRWRALLSQEEYKNSRDFGLFTKGGESAAPTITKAEIEEWRNKEAYEIIAYTPVGNDLVLDMAWRAVSELNMGGDDDIDLLNVYLDASRNVVSRYGPESIEAEDMLYRLDRSLSTFIDNVRSVAKDRDVIFVLTSDGGTSPSYDANCETVSDMPIFNSRQFAVILNTFIGARYGSGRWVLGYENRSIYLNHELIYKEKLNLNEVQDEVASFALQFRGVSHALTASAMRSSYFGSGYGEMMQNGFYPRRSGDVVINLMPEWIESADYVRSMSGSMYGYDTHVPLLIWGSGVDYKRVTERVEMNSLAPTLAAMMGITAPAAAEGLVVEAIISSGN